jgi:RNA polymerase sigma-70 factor, ECF subfamily
MDLGALLERCRRGDDLAWEELVRRYQGRGYGVALHYLGNGEDARDLAQEVFIKIYRRLSSCTNDETFVPWMIRLTRNASIDRLRRMKTRPSVVGAPIEEFIHIASTDPGPDAEWRGNARRRLLFRAMSRLSRINREILMLKEIQGMSLEAIASMLHIPVGTVKSRSNRARLELASEVIALTGPGGTEKGENSLP